jgi:hypothetical protein
MGARSAQKKRLPLLFENPPFSVKSDPPPPSKRVIGWNDFDFETTASSSSISESEEFQDTESDIPDRPPPQQPPDQLREIHSAIEIYEHRIQSGKDKVRIHPAQAVDAFRNEGPPKTLTREERRLQQRYGVEEERLGIPEFWEDRAYDRPGQRMSKSETAKMETMIRELTKEPITRKQREEQAKAEGRAIMRTRRAERQLEKMEEPPFPVLRMTSRYVCTDDSDGTDWEDF